MKKTQVLFLTAVLALTFSGLALAQMDKGKDMMGDKGMGMMKGDMMGKDGMMGGKMMGMMGMCPMMKSMMERSVVATSDGGVVVVMGNKLTKYDKDLNAIKEVELKMDMEGMQKMMDNMKSMCPMMGKGMMDGMMGDMKEDAKKSEEPKPAASNETAPATADEHSSHH